MSDTITHRVALDARSYDVVIGEGVLAQAGARAAPFMRGGRVFTVTDDNVARLHGASLAHALAASGLAEQRLILPPGEAQKSFAGLERVIAWLLDGEITRQDIVIAFGGGVIGDLAGFAAGVVKRGVDFIQIPTTLLAQVDSSVGGKTAIDTPHGKNLVGLFYQPRLVLADCGLLSTLPRREVMAGYAEVVKYGLLGDAGFYEWCEANAARVLACDPAALAHAVSVCVAAKARIVAEDEREGGARALLNLGHTFAHALETQAGYDGHLLHGEAVAAGMALAFEYSAQTGLLSAQHSVRVARHLASLGFELDLRRLPGAPFTAGRLLAAMAQDKKNEPGRMTLILAHEIGAAFVDKNADVARLSAFLEAKLAP